MTNYTEAYVGIDVSKERNAIAVAESLQRGGEVRYFGEVNTSETAMRRTVSKIAERYDVVHFCYEAGPTGYGLYRLIAEMGYECMVVAPSLIPTKPGDRVKTDRRDAVNLAKLLRADELTAVWFPMRVMKRCAIWCAQGPPPSHRCACIDNRSADLC